MTDITKEQIEKFRDVTLFMCKEWAGALADKNTSSFDYTNSICDLALRGLETHPKPIAQAPRDGRKIILFLLGGNLCFGSFSQKEQIWVTSEGEHLDKLPVTGFLLLSALGKPKGETLE